MRACAADEGGWGSEALMLLAAVPRAVRAC